MKYRKNQVTISPFIRASNNSLRFFDEPTSPEDTLTDASSTLSRSGTCLARFHNQSSVVDTSRTSKGVGKGTGEKFGVPCGARESRDEERAA